MSSLKDNFAELLTRIRHGREVGHASFEPLYYLVFPPHQILEVKRQLPAWIAKLRNEGWEVHVFSMAEAIAALLGQAPLRQIWLSADRSAPLAWEKTNRSLANTLARGALQARLEAVLEPLQGQATPSSLSPTSKRCIPISGSGPLKASCKGNVRSPRSFCIQGCARARRISSFWAFIPKTGIIARSMWAGKCCAPQLPRQFGEGE